MSDTHARVTDVHTEHCCLRHGCKYDWHQIGGCTVTSGKKQQSFPCEHCESEIEEEYADAVHVNEIITRIEDKWRGYAEDEYWRGYHDGRDEMYVEMRNE